MQVADYLTSQTHLVDLRHLGQTTFTTESGGNDITRWQNVKDFVRQKVFRFRPEYEDISSQLIMEGSSDVVPIIVRRIPDEHKITLMDIPEPPRIKKLLWDIVMDSDALYAHFEIELAGVWDVQLMRVYLNKLSRRPLLADLFRAEGILEGEELTAWEQSKSYNYPRGYEEWRERPISQTLKRYAIGDVTPMEKMMRKFKPQLGVEGMMEVEKMTRLLIAETWERDHESTRAQGPGAGQLVTQSIWKEALSHQWSRWD